MPGQQHAQRRGARNSAQSARTRHPAAWAIAGGAIVVVVLAALLIVNLVSGGRPPSHGKLAANTHGPAVTARPTPSPSLGPTTPAAFGGTWSGPVTQASATFTVTVTLTSGQSSGSIDYTGADFTCSGDLSLTSATATTLTTSQGIVVGQSTCDNGTVTLTLSGQSSINFDFEGQPAATGTLSRT